MKNYSVALSVTFIERHEVEARNEKEAFELARQMVRHGMGEDVSLFEVELITS